MNRGRGRHLIFHSEAYYQAFLKTLEEANKRFDAVIHAYCLMGNHYHLLIETPRANLDRIMRHINGVYTQRHNRLKKTDGPLFRGRYKAILVDEDDYLLQVGRYIHRNPIDMKKPLVDKLEDYPWSSYPSYVKKYDCDWLSKEQSIRMIGGNKPVQRYREFVADGVDEETKNFYHAGNQASVIGDKSFREKVLKHREEKTGARLEALIVRPKAEQIVNAVAKVYRCNKESIVLRKKGKQPQNEPRKIAIYACQTIGDLPQKEIAIFFGLNNPGSVSPAIAWVKSNLNDTDIKKRLKKIEKNLSMIK
jgi:putative transposase